MLKTALVIGYGSIGKRHTQVLEDLGCQVSVVTSQRNLRYTTYPSIDRALLSRSFDFIIIANPTHLHFQTLSTLVECDYDGVVLVEKPLFSAIEMLPTHHFRALLVAYNLRFHPLLLALKTRLEGQNILTFSAHVGQYLPHWRKGDDYRISYSSKAAEGGGALRDLSHELDYCLWLCGTCQSVTATGGHVSTLEIDSDDAFSMLLLCDDCAIVNIHVNYLDRIPQRRISVNTQAHTFVLDFIAGTLSVNGIVQMSVSSQAMHDTYRYQAEALLAHDFQRFCDYSAGLRVVKLISTIEKAAKTKSWVTA